MFLSRSLSGRLLSLTIVIVMVTEILVFLPSVARFRQDFLLERLQMAQIASLALLAADDAMVEEALEAELLANAEVSSIVLRRDRARQLVLSAPAGVRVAETFDLRDASPVMLVADALIALVRTEPRMIRVIGQPVLNAGETIEITLAETALFAAMWVYARNILLLSLIISTITGLLVFVICRRLIVTPIEAVVEDMGAFQADPEGAPLGRASGSGLVEIARAENALSEMQGQVRSALKQKTRLAELGSAVAKISHDLRNMLAVAQMTADRLESSTDPIVTRLGPKLIKSLDRAVALCISTLQHGKAEEAPPEARHVALRSLVEEVEEAVFDENLHVRLANDIGPDAEAMADPDHLFRILSNLTRNARQAMEASGRGDCVTIWLEATDSHIDMRIADNGPGMPAKALEHLFQPFRGGVAKGGTGLGLAIAAELAEANGGSLELVGSTTEGTEFRLKIPA